jgi:hypothetical protein
MLGALSDAHRRVGHLTMKHRRYPVTHALVRGSMEPRAVCGKDIPAHRLVWPNTAMLLAVISCSDCRAALNWPRTMDFVVKKENQ